MAYIAFHSVKGGSGCTTVAALFATQLHRGQNTVHLCTSGDHDQLADAAAILGVPVDGPMLTTIGPGFTMGVERPVYHETEVIQVVDVGTRFGGHLWPAAVARVLVIRNDYIAMKRAVARDDVSRENFAGMVVLEDPTWPLHDIDVADVVGLPVLETFTTDASWQRHLDAGIMASRRHPHFFHSLDRLVGVRA